MHQLESSILHVFKRNPGTTYSTTELVHEIFTTEYAGVNQQIHSGEKRDVRDGYAVKAKLHRKLLYHVNKLVDDGVLVLEGLQGKGEKRFKLAMEEGELVVKGGEKKIIIAKPASIITHIDGYEQRGLVRKFHPESWLNKEHSILLDCDAFLDPAALQERLQRVFPATNDVIALHHFESLVERASPEALETFLHYLKLDAHDYDVDVSLLFSFPAPEHEEKLFTVLRRLVNNDDRWCNFVVTVNPRVLTHRESFFRELCTLFMERKVKLTLKNATLTTAPILYGRAGAYALTNEEWAYYKEHIKGNADGCIIGGISTAVDINRFFDEHNSATAFREMLLRIAHGYFEVDERKRKYFATSIGDYAPRHGTKEFFKVVKHYLRFWNYDWSETEQYLIIDLLSSARDEVLRFSKAQETIFSSCGLPIRFSVDLSTSFAAFDQDFFSERRYKKTVVGSLKDLQTKEMKEYLRIRERLFKVFGGADRLRFFIARATPVEEVLQIARYLLRAYDYPTFTLDFGGKTGEMKLTSFLEE